jgi:hypothetical protein
MQYVYKVKRLQADWVQDQRSGVAEANIYQGVKMVFDDRMTPFSPFRG